MRGRRTLTWVMVFGSFVAVGVHAQAPTGNDAAHGSADEAADGADDAAEEGGDDTDDAMPVVPSPRVDDGSNDLPVVPSARFDLSDDGSSYVRLLTWHQLWARAIELNPGTTMGGEPRDWTWDVGIRRSRLLVLAQLPRVQLVFHVGINNQTFSNTRKPQVFIHDAWGSVDVVMRDGTSALTIGAGLHYWNGISRLANASTINTMALDSPIVNWPTIDKTDQFARQLGLFARGQIGDFDYRVAVNRPFAPGGELLPGVTDYRPSVEAPAIAGYFQWFFLERESNALPYAVGTYLGKKRVLTLGAGFHSQNDAMGRLAEGATDPTPHDLRLFGADLFVDHPVGHAAITGYVGYYHYDFGPDYVRNVGIMNVGEGGTSFAGAGNAYPVISTGHHLYTQAGLLLPRVTPFLQLQPYATFHLARAEAIDDPVTIFELGLNWFFLGHNAKLTTHWRSRPVLAVEGQDTRVERRANELILQLQVFL